MTLRDCQPLVTWDSRWPSCTYVLCRGVLEYLHGRHACSRLVSNQGRRGIPNGTRLRRSKCLDIPSLRYFSGFDCACRSAVLS